MNKEMNDALKIFMSLVGDHGFGSIFGGNTKTEETPFENLGDGFELRPIEILAEGGQFVLKNRKKYSHLYHKGLKVSDMVFRKGGTCTDFKEGYCSLIYYTQVRPHTEKTHGFDLGNHVIINKYGDICLEQDSGKNVSHRGGNLGKLGDTYYNLLTREPVLTCSSSGTIDGKRYVFVEHRYDWYDKKLPLGIYRIDKITCEFEKIDETR